MYTEICYDMDIQYSRCKTLITRGYLYDYIYMKCLEKAKPPGQIINEWSPEARGGANEECLLMDPGFP